MLLLKKDLKNRNYVKENSANSNKKRAKKQDLDRREIIQGYEQIGFRIPVRLLQRNKTTNK